MENDIATNQLHAMIGSTNILAWDRVSSLQTLLERRFVLAGNSLDPTGKTILVLTWR